MRETLCENIRRFRQAKGLNQVQLAKALNITKQCVSNWENDNVVPSVEMLIKLADFFGVTTDLLLGRDQTETIDASGLTEKHVEHLRLLVNDLKDLI